MEKTLVDFGDRVKAGQELAFIDTTTYEALARQAAANVERAKATAANAEQSLKRMQELRKVNIASQSDLDAAVAAAEQARADVKAQEAADAVAQLNLARSRVKAPFDAAVAERIASAGDYLKVGAPLFRMVNDAVLKYIVQAPEAYAGQVKKEQQVIFRVDAYGTNQTFEGTVYLISPAVNLATRAFPFGALVQNADHKLKASTYARGKLILQRDVRVGERQVDDLRAETTPSAGVEAEATLVHGEEVGDHGLAALRLREPRPSHLRPVQLAVGRPGQRVCHFDFVGSHVLGKLRVGETSEVVDLETRRVARFHNGDDRGLRALPIGGEHGRVSDEARGAQRLFDLQGADPVAPGLEHLVATAHEVEESVRVPPHEVTGEDHELGHRHVRRAERVRPEHLGRGGGVTPVPARQPRHRRTASRRRPRP